MYYPLVSHTIIGTDNIFILQIENLPQEITEGWLYILKPAKKWEADSFGSTNNQSSITGFIYLSFWDQKSVLLRPEISAFKTRNQCFSLETYSYTMNTNLIFTTCMWQFWWVRGKKQSLRSNWNFIESSIRFIITLGLQWM